MDTEAMKNFSPVIPLPRVWDPAKRLQGLKESLDPRSKHYYFIERMHPNLKAVIAAYEAGQITNGGTFYFMGGKMVPKSEAESRKELLWTEVRSSNL